MAIYTQSQKKGTGVCLPGKCIPCYPHWHKICGTLPLLAKQFGSNPYPYWHKSTKRVPFASNYVTLCGITIVEKWIVGTIDGLQHQKFGQFCAIFDILHSPWHNHWKTHTLSGTHLVFTTLP